MLPAALSRTCPWCFGSRTCRACDGKQSARVAVDEEQKIGVRSACAACGGTGECLSCKGTGQLEFQSGHARFTAAAEPQSSIHKLLRLRPGNAPHCLCSSQRFEGGTLVDVLTASVLLTPLIVIPIAAQATRWWWLMLLCVPAAYVVAVWRREFELQEWLARDLAGTMPAPDDRDSAVVVGVGPQIGLHHE